MIKRNNYFTCFIFFCRFTLLVCGEKNILANLTNSQEPVDAGCFWLLGAGATWKKNRSRSRFLKKIRSRSRKKICRLPSPAPPPSRIFSANLAPNPWLKHSWLSIQNCASVIEVLTQRFGSFFVKRCLLLKWPFFLLKSTRNLNLNRKGSYRDSWDG